MKKSCWTIVNLKNGFQAIIYLQFQTNHIILNFEALSREKVVFIRMSH